MITWMGHTCGYGLIPDYGPNCGRPWTSTGMCWQAFVTGFIGLVFKNCSDKTSLTVALLIGRIRTATDKCSHKKQAECRRPKEATTHTDNYHHHTV